MIFSFDVKLINRPENTCSSYTYIRLRWYSLNKNRLYLLVGYVSINGTECRNKEYDDNRYIKENKINTLKLMR